MLINTNILDEVDGIGDMKKKDVEDYFKTIPWWKRILGVKNKNG